MNIRFRYRMMRTIALFVAVNMLAEALLPLRTFALTSGPSQPEVQSFEPVETTEMVDLFSGDFTYNIPLFELPGPNGGYPFNLAYHSGISMDQEASWVGLGWNLNPGAINRQMRGLPDDFDGDIITRKQDIKPNVTIGAGTQSDVEAWGAELNKVKKEESFPQLSLGIKVFYNTYKGVGYSIEPGLDFHKPNQKKLTAGIGFDFSLGNQDGIGAELQPTLSLPDRGAFHNTSFNVGIGYNSKRGLTDLSMGIRTQTTLSKNRKWTSRLPMAGTSSLSFAGGSYTPQVEMDMRGRNLAVSFKPGTSNLGIFKNIAMKGFFTTQYLKDRGKNRSIRAYGYLNMGESNDKSVTDFNREKDGMLRKKSPNLAIPGMTYDIYSVVGQGIASMYRPYVPGYGTLTDPKVESKTAGGAGGVEVGAGSSQHIGVNASVNYSKTASGGWEDNDYISGSYLFNPSLTTGEESYYFKTHGELTSESSTELNSIGGEKPVSIKLTQDVTSGINKKFTANNFIDKNGGIVPIADKRGSRKPRSVSLQPFKNNQLLTSASDDEILREFDIKYYTSANTYSVAPAEDLKRRQRNNKNIERHIGGFSALNAQGNRYVYGLPAYNLSQVECQFSANVNNTSDCKFVDVGTGNFYEVDQTDHYYSRTELPPYAHSYLLTSILGHDYVDVDNDGPSDNDLGYWVKFNYVQVNSPATPYKWRVPFTRANYEEGYKATLKDNRGSYMYGEKEVWHVATVETKTHIAVFHISQRKDAKGATLEAQNTNTLGASSYELDKIDLYTKEEYKKGQSARPIKSVHFSYTYDLCKQLPNSLNPETNQPTGKLTLKKVWFTYENNTRGELSPYEFNYHEQNPDYDNKNYDRWGNYKPVSTCELLDFPYVNQYDSETNHKQNASAWHLKEIILPSGGKINIDYEADDYAYVQNKTAMQMTPITAINGSTGEPEIGSPDDWIHFQLEQSIPLPPEYSTSSSEQQTAIRKELIRKKYLDGVSQIYFKTFMYLRGAGNNLKEFVHGYAEIDDWEAEEISGGAITKAKIQLKAIDGRHPFVTSARQLLRTSLPDMMGIIGNIDETANSKTEKINKVKSAIAWIPQLLQVFSGGFNNYADLNGWGKKIVLGKSWIRLNSPDKIKYGGGSRVKSIRINDGWSARTGGEEQDSEYGQDYSYRMTENGEEISSGVAEYEPLIGGDENPLRTAKMFPENIPAMTDNNLFFEYPINESYYPGASVGYSQVTVKSKAASEGKPSTGQTVHEFYTAKDFPVITDETGIDKRPFNLYIPIPLLGQIQVNNLTASQGYSIELNDMHGKPKKVTNYRQEKDANSNPLYRLISWVQYNYKTSNGKLDNLVNVLTADATTDERLMGVDYEFFNDMRKTRTNSVEGGLNLNLDISAFPPVPLSIPWPNIGKSSNDVRTAVTNKVIYRFGILESTEAYNDGSLVKTENKLFDAVTGRPLLTTVTNNFDEPVYKYDMPAYWAYEGMGAAYKNAGITFSSEVESNGGLFNLVNPTTTLIQQLVPGDEFIISYANGKYKGIYVQSPDNTNLSFYVEGNFTPSPNQQHHFQLVRSGRRNMLDRNASTITALANPLLNRENTTCTKNIPLPTPSNIQRSVNPMFLDAVELLNQLLTHDVNNNDIMDYYEPKGTIDIYNDPYYSQWGKPLRDYYDQTGVYSGQLNYLYGQDNPNLLQGEIGVPFLNSNDPTGGTGGHYYFYGDILTPGGYNPSPSQDLQDWVQSNYTAPYAVLIASLRQEISDAYINKRISQFIAVHDINKCYDPPGNPNVHDDVQIHIKYYNSYGTLLTAVIPVVLSVFDGNIPATIKAPTYDYGQQPFTASLKKIDQVIQATATKYSDNWGQDYTDARLGSSSTIDLLFDKHAFANGQKGIWWPEKNFVYVDDRKHTALDNRGQQTLPVNISTDGTFDDVPLFDCHNPVFPECAPKWKLTNEITRYNPYGFETENRDILNRYSAALYGYDGKLSTAVAANARYTETGFEGFEEYDAGATVNQFNVSTGNIDIFTELLNQSYTFYEKYRVRFGNKNVADCDLPFPAGGIPSIISNAKVNAASICANNPATGQPAEVSGLYDIVSVSPRNGFSTITLESGAPGFNFITPPCNSELKDAWTGTIEIPRTITPAATSYPGVLVSNAKAHTGKKSLRVEGGASYLQNRLRPEVGKEYVFSCWVSKDNTDRFSYVNSPYVTIRFYAKPSPSGTAAEVFGSVPVTLYAGGKMIEGWQKIEGRFRLPEETDRIAITLQGGANADPVNERAGYFDDIRIFPVKGNMQSFVYNKENLRLSAVLDNNNYATLYYYDEQGNLFLVKKETEKGIKTIQESRSHQAERP